MDVLSIRYNIQHIGDITLDLLEKPALLGKCFASGVALTYDIKELNRKRLEVLRELGERVAQVTAVDPAALSTDEAIKALTARLAEINKAQDDKVRERELKLRNAPAGAADNAQQT